jgi:hypothetical protein
MWQSIASTPSTTSAACFTLSLRCRWRRCTDSKSCAMRWKTTPAITRASPNCRRCALRPTITRRIDRSSKRVRTALSPAYRIWRWSAKTCSCSKVHTRFTCADLLFANSQYGLLLTPPVMCAELTPYERSKNVVDWRRLQRITTEIDVIMRCSSACAQVVSGWVAHPTTATSTSSSAQSAAAVASQALKPNAALRAALTKEFRCTRSDDYLLERSLLVEPKITWAQYRYSTSPSSLTPPSVF